MPFSSDKQRKWMHANEPEMAKKWEKKKKTEFMITYARAMSGPYISYGGVKGQ